MTPFPVKDKENDRTIGVPCGKCPNCVKRRVSGWSFRLMQQEKVSQSTQFITLTYDTKYVPITKYGYMSLNFRDCELFFKRLRKAHPKGHVLKYFLVGEYGGKTNRPHYHAILFNVDIKLIQKAWQKGQIHYGTVTGASIGYCLKYISKPSKIPMHKNDDRVPERARMSKGLGANYLSSQMIEWHRQSMNNRMHLSLTDGRKVSMPRYYKEKIYSKAERNTIGEAVSKEREKEREKVIQKYGKDYFLIKTQRDIAAFKKCGIKHFEKQIL